MASVKKDKNKNLTPLLKTNFSRQETSLGPKRCLHSKGPKNVICLWQRQGNIKLSQSCIVYFCSIFLVSAKEKLHFQDLQSEGIFSGPKTMFLIMKSWSSEVVSIKRIAFQDLQSKEIFLDPKAEFIVMKSWTSEVVSDFCFCLF